ncbi:MAG TPA: 3-oxoacyl-[acyl-carrier-protein] synthase III C-terminal domain-containing protein, partial [Thermoanaerobaculia bacterium]|nr:3-oxoacyl-[acyl-carrier-protein] synthase III C-terminal domain-containing protein [Thermoanaerobaculia bacterium]
LFGDGAGAVVLEASDTPGILASDLHADGRHLEILCTPGTVAGGKVSGQPLLKMDGPAVFKLAVTRMPEVTREVLSRHGYTLDELDLLVMHQANLRINEAAQKALGLPDSKVHHNIYEYGNTTSATLPLCFHEARAAGKAPPGSLVAFTALGAGLHWGAALMRV